MDPKKRIRWVGVGVLVLGLFLYLLRDVLAPVFLALVLAYLIDPVIDRFEKRRIPRTPAIFLFLLAVLVAIVLIVLILIPMVQKEVGAVVDSMPAYSQRLREWAVPRLQKVAGQKLPTTLDEAVNEISANIQNISPDILKPFASILKKIFSNTLYIILGLLNLVVVPVFTFYFLRDFDRMKSHAADMIPLAYRDWTVGKFKQVDETLGAFFRGQLTVCTLLAAGYSVGLLITGIDMAVVIGVTSGYLFIVPYLGTIFGIVAASLMALLKFHDFWHVFEVWCVFGVVQLCEAYLLTPRIVGNKVGLNPVMVVLALLIGGSLFGFLGILLAVPVAAVLKIFASDLINYYRSSELFLGGVRPVGASESKETK